MTVHIVGKITDLTNLPLLRNPAQFGLFIEMGGFGLRRAQVAVSVYATREEVVHHALFDRLVLGNQGFRLLDQVVQRRQNPGNLSLLAEGRKSQGGSADA